MNVQAFFQQTSSRVLYTMTSKAHGYGVEEAITSSSKASLRRAARRRYIRTTQWRRHGSRRGGGGSHAKSHMNGTVANSCQMLLCLSRHHLLWLCLTWLSCLSSSRLLTCARGALRLTITTSSSKLESKFKSELVCCRSVRRREVGSCLQAALWPPS